MKKHFIIYLFFITISGYSQKTYSETFDVKNYARYQTDIIQAIFDLTPTELEEVYKANLFKAYSVHKHLILAEKRGKINNKSLKAVLKNINEDAERGSGYQQSMKHILGEERYQIFVKKFYK